MHASVTENKGFAYLFLGKSGTGKSTHSSLWLKYIANSELLNDDNPAVRCFPDGRIIVYGTPWSGKTPCYRNKSLPVGAFVRLQQHPQNEIQEEPKIKAFASILSSCSTMIWDKNHTMLSWPIFQTLSSKFLFTFYAAELIKKQHSCVIKRLRGHLPPIIPFNRKQGFPSTICLHLK